MALLDDRSIIWVGEEPAAAVPLARDLDAERLNALTHGAGLLLSIPAVILLIARAISYGGAWRIAGCSVFGAALIAMYLASTLSHSFSQARPRRLLRSLDQASIYLLIVATYTPFSLTYLRAGWWLPIFGLMWVVALWGCVAKVAFAHRIETATPWSYLLLAWSPLLAGRWLLEVVPAAALGWMFAGGLFYTFGTFFLGRDEERPYFHAIWHMFVLAGSACHYFAIFRFVGCWPHVF
jgi:hemolysin III